MQRILLSLGVLFVGPAFAQPVIHCAAPVHDAGFLINTGRVEHTFTVFNRGGEDLNIVRVRTGCGIPPRDYMMFSTKLVPGSSVDLKASLPLQGRYGPTKRTVTVHSDDPKTPTLSLTLKACATNEVVVSPQSAWFGTIKPGQRVTRNVMIHNTGTRPLQITGIKSHAGATTSLESLRPGVEYRIWISNPKLRQAGRYSDYVLIETNHPMMPTQRLALYGRVEEKASAGGQP